MRVILVLFKKILLRIYELTYIHDVHHDFFIMFDYRQSGLMVSMIVSSTMWIALIIKDHKDSFDVRVRLSH